MNCATLCCAGRRQTECCVRAGIGSMLASVLRKLKDFRCGAERLWDNPFVDAAGPVGGQVTTLEYRVGADHHTFDFLFNFRVHVFTAIVVFKVF